jgi:hypothetical protein
MGFVVDAVLLFIPVSIAALTPVHSTECSTRYRTRHFFNNFTTNEDIATKSEEDYRHIPPHFSNNERTPVQISLQYVDFQPT